MYADVLTLAAKLGNGGEQFVIAHVVRREPPSSANVGDVALITMDGAFHGWLGGTCIQATVVREAQDAMADGQPRLIRLSPDPSEAQGVTVHPMTCHSGGAVDIYIEPVIPAPRLTIFGASPVALALAKIARAMNYRVEVCDRDADRVAQAPQPRGAGEPIDVVVATYGAFDEAALETALGLAPRYLGLVASRQRFAQMCDALTARGVSRQAIARIHSPAGLDIGARTPEEIAVSILAEVVREVRRVGSRDDDASAVPTDRHEARDPVCGMVVQTSGARHVADFDRQSYYFCCAACREQFLAHPASYVAAGNKGSGS